MNRISEEQVSRLLRRVAERIELLQDEASLVERALEGAVDSFFRVGSPIGPVYIAVGSNGIRHLAPAGSPVRLGRPRGRGTGRFQSRWQRDGEQPYTAPRAVPPRCPQRRPYGELRFRHGREGEAAARGGRLAGGTGQSSLRGDANNRCSVPRYLS